MNNYSGDTQRNFCGEVGECVQRTGEHLQVLEQSLKASSGRVQEANKGISEKGPGMNML